MLIENDQEQDTASNLNDNNRDSNRDSKNDDNFMLQASQRTQKLEQKEIVDRQVEEVIENDESDHEDENTL